MEILQESGRTLENRNPEHYDAGVVRHPRGRILSFGCSTGEELLELRARFPESEIVGCEIDKDRAAIARERTGLWVGPFEDVPGDFDLIFAMSVLCRYGGKTGSTAPLDYGMFSAAVEALAGRLRQGGYLYLFNTNYDPAPILSQCGVYPTDAVFPPGFVPVFYPSGEYMLPADQERIKRVGEYVKAI
jgi:hypothetical protein